MNTSRTLKKLSIAVVRRIVITEGTKTSRGVNPPMGMGTAARNGDRSVLVAPTAMVIIPRVGIAGVEEVMITGKTTAIGRCPRRSPPPVIQRVKRVKRRARGIPHSSHGQMN
jgi:hypothetical protein